ncbi:MAG TPA: metallophosphoesterase family protein, partial [Candidatus Glassbacteria bacterium]|nr:metallophosphoesterase family protein [Candidatus Glassbacteria bacterium]
CLGDVVGYGAYPNACLDRVRSVSSRVIMGNHDAAAVGMTPVEYFNPAARTAALWTGRQLGEENQAYLRNLPYGAEFEDFRIVHSTPDVPSAWKYLLTADSALLQFDYFDGPLLFYGHTHVPLAFDLLESGDIAVREDYELALEDGHRYIINAGSVGQPRDGDPRAAFAVYDSRGPKVTILRQEYDIRLAQRRILEAGLPPILAERLSFGS